jgi:hypothetical protein
MRGYMRLVALTALIVAIFGGLPGSGAGNSDFHMDSGIVGRVTIAPVGCGADQVGRDCSAPYDARIRVRRASDRKLIARVRANKKGRFRVDLYPGRYVLDPVNGDPFPRAPDMRVRVNAHQLESVHISYDTGAQ